MNLITLLILLIWLACGVLVYRFVRRTGGFSEVGKIAHWFGGAFVLVGLAAGMILIYALVDGNFSARVNAYTLTHQIRLDKTSVLIKPHTGSDTVTIFRHGSVNGAATMAGGQVKIDESQTIRTSWWWMLWDTKYESRELS